MPTYGFKTHITILPNSERHNIIMEYCLVLQLSEVLIDLYRISYIRKNKKQSIIMAL